jgi:hypothetical protein
MPPVLLLFHGRPAVSKLRLHFYLWLLGLLEATFQGGALGVKAFIGLATAHAAGLDVPMLDLEQLYYIFLSGALYHFCSYVTEHSLLKSLFDLARPEPSQLPVPPEPAMRSGLAEATNNQTTKGQS